MATVKVLSITSLQFRLPDNFDGGITEALTELVNYHNNVKDQPTSTPEYLDKSMYDMSYGHVNVVAFDNFIDTVRSGKRLLGLFKIDSCEISDTEEIDG